MSVRNSCRGREQEKQAGYRSHVQQGQPAPKKWPSDGQKESWLARFLGRALQGAEITGEKGKGPWTKDRSEKPVQGEHETFMCFFEFEWY